MCFGARHRVGRAAGVGAIAAAGLRGSGSLPPRRRWAPLCCRLSTPPADGYDALVDHGVEGDDVVLPAPRDDRRIRLAPLRRALCGPRGREPAEHWSRTTTTSTTRLPASPPASFRPATAGGSRRWTNSPATSPTSTCTTRPATAPPTTAATSGTRSTTRRPAPPRIAPTRSCRRTAGGGPSAEHNYTTGLLLHYFLTGSRTLARGGDSARRLGHGHGRWPQVAFSLDRSPRHGAGQRHPLARLPRPRPRRRQFDQRAARRASPDRQRRAISRRPTR